MYAAHEFDVTPWIRPGQSNTLAVKVTPERALQDVDGVELADSWNDWINWDYLGLSSARTQSGSARHVVRARPQRGHLEAGVLESARERWESGLRTRQYGTSAASHRQRASDDPRQRAQLFHRNACAACCEPRSHVPARPPSRRADGHPCRRARTRRSRSPRIDSRSLTYPNPDLWWPYTMGQPNLYDLRLEFRVNNRAERRRRTSFRHSDRHPGSRRPVSPATAATSI